MRIQLPATGQCDMARSADQLRQLEKDKVDAKYEIRQVLDRYRESTGLARDM